MSATQTAPPLHDRPVLSELAVEHAFDMAVDLEPAELIPTATGTIMNFIAKGGRVEGPRIRGELLPGGADAIVVGTDQIGRMDVRATIRTDDDVPLRFTTLGLIKIPPDGVERLEAGERLPFEEIYMRTTPVIGTTDERYAWLSQSVLVGHNELSKDHVDYRVYRLL